MTRASFAVVAFRVFFLVGFPFLVGVAAWAVITIQRLERKQASAIETINLMAAQLKLRRSVDELVSGDAVGRRVRESDDA